MPENVPVHTGVHTPVSTKFFLSLLLAIALIAAVLSFLSPAAAAGFFLSAIFITLAFEKPIWLIYALTFYIPFEPFLLKFTSDNLFLFLKYGFEAGILILFLIAVGKHLYHPQSNTSLFLKGDIPKGIPARTPQAGRPPLPLDSPAPQCGAESLGVGRDDRSSFANGRIKEGFIRTPIDKPLAAFIIITAISAIINLTHPFYWIAGLRQIFRFTLLYYAVIYLKISKKQIKTIIIILISLLIFQSLIGASQAIIGKSADRFLLPGEQREFASIVPPDYVSQFWSSGQRIFATMGRYDRLGTFMCLVMLLYAGILMEIPLNLRKKKLLIIFLAAIPILVLTYSRMSWIGFLIGTVVMGVIIKKNKKIFLAILLAAAISVLVFIFQLKTEHFRLHLIEDNARMTVTERFLALFSFREFENSYKGYGRLYFIANTPIKVVKNYPLFGLGLGQYGSGITQALHNTNSYDKLKIPFGIENKYGTIDNNWFSLWGETGALGLIAFGFIMFNLSKYSLELYKNSEDSLAKGLTLGFLGIIAAISFQSFLGPYFEIRPLSYNFWLLAGIVVVMGKISGNNDDKKQRTLIEYLS